MLLMICEEKCQVKKSLLDSNILDAEVPIYAYEMGVKSSIFLLESPGYRKAVISLPYKYKICVQDRIGKTMRVLHRSKLVKCKC